MSLALQLMVLARSLPAAFSPPRRSSWSFLQRLFVEATRNMLMVARRLPAKQQRERCRPPAEPTTKGVSRVELSLAGRPAYRYSGETTSTSGLLLHFHGGGYVIGGATLQNAYLSRLTVACGVPVISLEYSLAPESPYPAAVNDAVNAVRALVAGGQSPTTLILTGESAGGGLALATLLKLRDEGGPVLGGAILGCPWTDLTCPGRSMQTNADADCFDASLAGLWASMYCRAEELRAPLVSPAHADLSGLPPLQVIVGDCEVLRDDTLTCAARANASGVPTEVIVGADAVHCWYVTDGLLPGPRDTLQRMAQFVGRVVGGPEPS